MQKKRLITIHTDADFALLYKGEELIQHNEEVYMVFNNQDEFASHVLSEEITSNNETGRHTLREMVYHGEGCYGNYSLSIEKYVPFVNRLDH